MTSTSTQKVSVHFSQCDIICTSKFPTKEQRCNINTAKALNDFKKNPLKSLSIATGKKHGITVIDIDIPKNGKTNDGKKLWDALMKKYNNGKDINTLTDSTPSGGIHYYFKYVDLPCGISSIYHKDKKYSIDILNGQNICFISPMFRPVQHCTNGRIKKKQGYYKCINDVPIIEMPKWLEKCLKNMSKAGEKKPIVFDEEPGFCTHLGKYYEIVELLSEIDNNRFKDYDMWIKLAHILVNEIKSKELAFFLLKF
jgi:hypothetical protein